MSTPDDYATEWEKCFAQTDKFDGYLKDARMYGFTLITGLTTASSFLGFSPAADTIQVGVIIVTMVLVGILCLIDGYYQKLLSRLLLRAKRIEQVNNKKRELAHYLSRIYNEGLMSNMIFGIYVGFVIALAVLGYYAISAAAGGAGDLVSRLSNTAYLWIPLVLTTAVIIGLLAEIFNNQRTEKKCIQAAMQIINGARGRLVAFEAADDKSGWVDEYEKIDKEILDALEK
jgi:hypothetical protein